MPLYNQHELTARRSGFVNRDLVALGPQHVGRWQDLPLPPAESSRAQTLLFADIFPELKDGRVGGGSAASERQFRW
jgi:hypothetical protein